MENKKTPKIEEGNKDTQSLRRLAKQSIRKTKHNWEENQSMKEPEKYYMEER